MATKLKNMKLTSVDLVRAGANQEADIGLFKSAGPQAEYDEALVKSARSILEDPDLTEDQQAGMLAKSVDDYRAALEKPEDEPEEPDGEEVMVEKEPEEEAAEDLDEIEEVEKNYDTIEEVQKFNPFHDALGRFASKNGFSTYSANPKMKVAQPSIIRSAQAGHGKTMNVHRESKGENIGQNYTWLQTGQKPAFLTSGSGTQQTPPPPPVPKPKRTRKPKAQQQTQPQQAQQNPSKTAPGTPTLDKEAKGVSLTAADSQALQMRTRMGQPANTIQAAKDHDQARVPGKDITASVDVSAIKVERGGRAIDAIAKAQGWDKAPAVTNDKDLFDKMAMKSGRVLIRTVGDDARSNQTARDVARTTMTSGTTPLGGTGLKAYGEGLYMVSTSLKAGTGSMDSRVRQGQRVSYSYGSTQMMATVHPKARIATATKARQLIREYNSLSSNDQARFGFSQNAYIAAKGFDGVQWHESRNPGAYATIFNKSALVFYGETNR